LGGVVMKALCLLVVSAAVCLLLAPLRAGAQKGVDQVGEPTIGIGPLNPYDLQLQKHWAVAGKVTTLQGDPIQGAKVVVEPNGGGGFRVLVTNFQGEFLTDYYLNSDLVKEFNVNLLVTKKGFLKAHELIEYGSSAEKPVVLPVTLRDPHEDPALLSQADLISGLTPRLKQLGAADGLSAKSEKDYAHGVEDFLDRNHPDKALAPFLKVIHRDASCAPCLVMLGLAELGSGDWDGASRNFSEAVSKTLADRTKGRPEPLLAYGVMQTWRHDPENASGYFVEALKFAPQDTLALRELGRSQLLLQNWGGADNYLSKALAAGAGPEVRLLRVQALMGGGDFEQASQEMTRYLNGRDVKTMPLETRMLWAQIENRKKVETTYAKVKTEVDEPIDYLHHAIPELKGMEPATDQTPLDSILTKAGQNVLEFFRSFPNTTSLEAIHQEKLRRNGKSRGALDQKFHYVCLTPAPASEPGFSEYRANLSGDRGQPQGLQDGFMLTSGFTSTSLLFHPAYQPEATFRYLGRQQINGRDTFVIVFAQRPARARMHGTFKAGASAVPTFTQGVAWIDAEKYHVLRLRTDLLAPLPEMRLKKQTTEINYGEAHFKNIAEGFWVPRQVTVTVDYAGRLLRNTHEYSDFKLFNVESKQKINKPKETAESGKKDSQEAN
jgi:tetratricopeptide (TPR) repeat protein